MAQQQQKVLIALCLLGAVAFASAQNFNYQNCARALAREGESYRNKLQQAAQKFTSQLQETGNQALDTSAFQSDIDKLVQSMNSVMDVSQGFDPSRFLSMYLENIRTMSSLLRSSFRLSVYSGGLNQYVEFVNSVYGLNNELLQNLMNVCIPSTKNIVLPA